MVTLKKSLNKNKRKLDFEIEWYNISIPEYCPCTGVLLNGVDWKSRPSIDRIDNLKGYIPGNVWVVSAWANAIKSNATSHQILAVADWMYINSITHDVI
jgi:hypothetical protein